MAAPARAAAAAMNSASAAALSTGAAPTVVGSRGATGVVTSTGGSGADSTVLSATLAEARANAVACYREILRDVPAMRENFTIIEDERHVRRVVRALFDRHAHIADPKVIDMLVFKARQEAGEIRNQWKSRTHVYQHIAAYNDAQRRAAHAAMGQGSGDSRRERTLADWKARGLVPAEVDGWAAYEHWKAEQDTKFEAFASDSRLFSSDDLQQNDADKNRCAMV